MTNCISQQTTSISTSILHFDLEQSINIFFTWDSGTAAALIKVDTNSSPTYVVSTQDYSGKIVSVKKNNPDK